MEGILTGKNDKEMKHNRQNLILLLLVGMIPLLAFSACIKEREIGGGTARESESVVRFSVWLPGAAHASRSLTEDNESHVQTIDILMFAQGGGAWQYRAGVSGAEITTDNTDAAKKTFTITMRHGDYDLVMLANARDKIVALDLAGKTKSQVLAMLAGDAPVGGKWIADDAAAGYKPIPMWGEIGDITIDGSTEITEADGITLTRMVARVDVLIATGVSDFKLTGVDVYNYNTKGSFAPLPTAWNPAANPPRATAPNVPSGSVLTKGPLEYNNGSGRSEINTAANKCEREIYLFEAENHTGAGHATGKDHLDRTCIVVGGVYDANGNGNFTDDGPATFYRADFSTGTGDAETFLDVLRNHHYTFTITKVSGSGYATSEDAFQGAKPIDFTVTVTNWGSEYGILLPIPERSSNCFIVGSNGGRIYIPVYSQIYWAMMDGGLTWNWMTSDMALGAEIVWAESANVIQNLSLTSVGHNKRDYLNVTTGSAQGNALVAIFNDIDGNGVRGTGENILWSWHIWVLNTDNMPQTIGGVMDRDLGALSNAWVTVGSMSDPVLGLSYQSGRKDPLRRAYPNNEYIKPALFGTMPTETDGTGNTVSHSVKNPTVRITDWTNQAMMWQDVNGKSVYDPCPEGWIVPKNGDIFPLPTYTRPDYWTVYYSGRGGYYPAIYNSGGAKHWKSWIREASKVNVIGIVQNNGNINWNSVQNEPAQNNNMVRCVRDL